MAVPKRRQSNSKQGRRRSHDALKPKQLQYCSRCSSAVLSHVLCEKCGHYQGRAIIAMEGKED